MTTATLTFDADTTANGSTLYAGTYTVSMPDDYDPALVTGEDVLCDHQIVIVDLIDGEEHTVSL